MQGKVAVLGGADFTMAFSALGLDTFPVEAVREQVDQAAREIVDSHYSLVVVAENIAPMAQEAFEPIQRKPSPCVVVVPFLSESSGYAGETLGKALKLATGINILES
ncbi:MAG: hypothetical protein JXA82_09335 [Sedimentisphaerales bacterium]|nr:hypothetical protein [Sedimentisphaerales bacterium]